MNAISAFASAIKERAAATGNGRIIVTSATRGMHGTRNDTGYSASEWGITGLMKSEALKFGGTRSW